MDVIFWHPLILTRSTTYPSDHSDSWRLLMGSGYHVLISDHEASKTVVEHYCGDHGTTCLSNQGSPDAILYQLQSINNNVCLRLMPILKPEDSISQPSV